MNIKVFHQAPEDTRCAEVKLYNTAGASQWVTA